MKFIKFMVAWWLFMIAPIIFLFWPALLGVQYFVIWVVFLATAFGIIFYAWEQSHD